MKLASSHRSTELLHNSKFVILTISNHWVGRWLCGEFHDLPTGSPTHHWSDMCQCHPSGLHWTVPVQDGVGQQMSNGQVDWGTTKITIWNWNIRILVRGMIIKHHFCFDQHHKLRWLPMFVCAYQNVADLTMDPNLILLGWEPFQFQGKHWSPLFTKPVARRLEASFSLSRVQGQNAIK